MSTRLLDPMCVAKVAGLRTMTGAAYADSGVPSCSLDALQILHPFIKRLRFLSDVGQRIFDGEMAGIQPMNLRIGNRTHRPRE